MKFLYTFFLLFAFSPFSQSQITFENSYSGGVIGFIMIDSNEYRYASVNLAASTIKLYHPNHALDQTITIPPITGGNSYINYISRRLFDCDSTNIEFILGSYCDPFPSPCAAYVDVYREDGTSLFHADSANAFTSIGGPTNFANLPVFQTPLGAKMRITNQATNAVDIYALCGQLYPLMGLNQQEDEYGQLMLAYPNPTRDLITLPYKLPDNVNDGDISIYDMNGNFLREFKVDKTFDSIIIDLSEYSAGAYYYQIATLNGVSKMQRILKQ